MDSKIVMCNLPVEISFLIIVMFILESHAELVSASYNNNGDSETSSE